MGLLSIEMVRVSVRRLSATAAVCLTVLGGAFSAQAQIPVSPEQAAELRKWPFKDAVVLILDHANQMKSINALGYRTDRV